MTRSELLHAAEVCVCGQREEDYGTPEDSFRVIGELWEISVSRRHRSPSARSAMAAYVYSVVFRIHFRSSQKARKTFWQKRSFFKENFDAEGVPPF